MIYITGDTHGDYDGFISRFGYNKMPNADDYVIITGDFGFIFGAHSVDELEKMKKLPFTVLFIDGNHENFSQLMSYDVEQWNGGKIHRIAPNIIHLMRGQLFEIEGKSFFTFGGAYSTDKMLRVEGESWWREERPNDAEYREAGETLKKCGFSVDYIITHTAPKYVIMLMGYTPFIQDTELCGFLDWVRCETKFKKHFFGHFHEDRQIKDDFFCLYETVATIE